MTVMAEQRTVSPTKLLFGAWVALGVAQLAFDAQHLIEGVLTSDDGSNVVHPRTFIISELEQVADGGGPEPDDERFWELVKKAITYGGVSIAAVADLFNIPPAVVQGWLDKKSAPKRYARSTVLSALADLLRELNELSKPRR